MKAAEIGPQTSLTSVILRRGTAGKVKRCISAIVPPPRATPQVFEFDQIPLCVGKLLGQTHCRSDRLRVVSNFCDGDCGAGEIHTRAYEISRRRSPRVASPRNLARVRVYFARPTIAMAEIRDYSPGPGSWKAD